MFQRNYSEVCVGGTRHVGEVENSHRLFIFFSNLPSDEMFIAEATWDGKKLERVAILQLVH